MILCKYKQLFCITEQQTWERVATENLEDLHGDQKEVKTTNKVRCTFLNKLLYISELDITVNNKRVYLQMGINSDAGQTAIVRGIYMRYIYVYME